MEIARYISDLNWARYKYEKNRNKNTICAFIIYANILRKTLHCNKSWLKFWHIPRRTIALLRLIALTGTVADNFLLERDGQLIVNGTWKPEQCEWMATILEFVSTVFWVSKKSQYVLKKVSATFIDHGLRQCTEKTPLYIEILLQSHSIALHSRSDDFESLVDLEETIKSVVSPDEQVQCYRMLASTYYGKGNKVAASLCMLQATSIPNCSRKTTTENIRIQKRYLM
jgi:hypothetical protein